MRYFPLGDDDSRPQLHLKSLSLSDWIEIDSEHGAQLERKAEILKNHRDKVLRVLPSLNADAAAIELNSTLRRHLSEHHSLPEKPEAAPRDAYEALTQIASWVQEDWAILSPEPPVRLIAGLVCFPSRWSLADKMGLDSNGIHAPVPRFSGIAKPTQTFLERLTVDKPMWRINWTIHDSNELFCPGPHPAASDLTIDNIISRTWLRIERQTLRRLPETKAVAFSIRTYMHSLQEVVSDPSRTRTLKSTLEKLNPETSGYKGMGAFHPLLLSAVQKLQ